MLIFRNYILTFPQFLSEKIDLVRFFFILFQRKAKAEAMNILRPAAVWPTPATTMLFIHLRGYYFVACALTSMQIQALEVGLSTFAPFPRFQAGCAASPTFPAQRVRVSSKASCSRSKSLKGRPYSLYTEQWDWLESRESMQKQTWVTKIPDPEFGLNYSLFSASVSMTAGN